MTRAPKAEPKDEGTEDMSPVPQSDKAAEHAAAALTIQIGG